jgi:hypothetical protein
MRYKVGLLSFLEGGYLKRGEDSWPDHEQISDSPNFASGGGCSIILSECLGIFGFTGIRFSFDT